MRTTINPPLPTRLRMIEHSELETVWISANSRGHRSPERAVGHTGRRAFNFLLAQNSLSEEGSQMAPSTLHPGEAGGFFRGWGSEQSTNRIHLQGQQLAGFSYRSSCPTNKLSARSDTAHLPRRDSDSHLGER
jgi:hypothetical protein